MNKNQEELEKIIRQFDYYHERSKSTDNLLSILTYTVGDDTDDFIEKLAQAILKDYVRRESIERRMVSYRIEDIIYPDGSKWRCLIYKDDTKEQCEWIAYQHIIPFINALHSQGKEK